MQIIFLANIAVAGAVGIVSLLAPATSARTVFQSTVQASHAVTLTGGFWTAIAILSVLGLFFPMQMSAVLLVQLLYKGLWLLRVAFPAMLRGALSEIPGGMSLFFLIWVAVIPFVYPWKSLLH